MEIAIGNERRICKQNRGAMEIDIQKRINIGMAKYLSCIIYKKRIVCRCSSNLMSKPNIGSYLT